MLGNKPPTRTRQSFPLRGSDKGTFRELLIDLEEDKAARAVVFGLLAEMPRGSRYFRRTRSTRLGSLSRWHRGRGSHHRGTGGNSMRASPPPTLMKDLVAPHVQERIKFGD
jgi:hypothetical protein